MMWQTQGTGETEKGRIHLTCLLSSLTAFKSYLKSGQSQDLNQLLSLLMVGATNSEPQLDLILSEMHQMLIFMVVLHLNFKINI